MSEPDIISRLSSALEGRYRIREVLGEGATAVVYLADDLRHDREVAFKVLREELSAALEGERFLAEIRTTAGLNNPHILPLFDSGTVGELLYYVTPVVSETLRDRIKRHRELPIEEAVAITNGIASALGAAHSVGVVHRDIKPSNVLLSGNDALVADFGIALATDEASDQRVTQTGTSLGSPLYMSPEQATGDHEIDARSDIFALGCVLYEMLVGEGPFVASSAGAIVARILTERARDPREIRPSIPANVAAAALKAIEKLPADRFSSADQLRQALRDPHFRHGEEPAAAATTGLGRGWALGGWVVAAIVGLSSLIGRGFSDRTPEGDPVVLTVEPAARHYFGGYAAEPYPAISPDGRAIAFVANTGNDLGRLFVRDVDAAAPRLVSAAVDVQWPFWSPDGSALAYFSEGQLWRVALDGSAPLLVADLTGFGGTWGGDGSMLVGTDEGIMRVMAAGGEAPRPVTTIDEGAGETSHRFPTFLDDGERFVYSAVESRPGGAGVYLTDVDGSERTRILESANNVSFLTVDSLLFLQGQDLVVQAFDDGSGEVSGPTRVVARGFSPAGTVRYAPFAGSAGSVAYRVESNAQTQLAMLDRSGSVLRTLGQTGSHVTLGVTPDGSRVVTSLLDEVTGGWNLWEIDVQRNTEVRLTRGGGLDSHPNWAPDGRSFVYSSTRSGQFSIYAMGSGGSDSLVFQSPDGRAVPHHWPRGADYVLYTEEDGAGPEGDVWALPLDGSEPRPLERTDADESMGRLSPDGRWLAYISDQTGRFEVYARNLETGDRVRVSTGGGSDPLWIADGSELLYLEADQAAVGSLAVLANVMSVAVDQASADLLRSDPRPLFSRRVPAFAFNELRSFDISGDGQRFFVLDVMDDSPSPLVVVVR
ncbi:MAG: protein kinase [Gemmatimonadota bacterium]